jgi:AraC family transcriptional regulator, transcriptional activator of pobA
VRVASGARTLELDRFADPTEPAEVVWLDGRDVGGAERRDPHRHDYHELIWIRSGSGRHLIDGDPVPVEEGTVTIIGRGQVHVFEEGRDLHGAVLRLRDELLLGDARAAPATWMLAGRCGQSVPVPEAQADRLETMLHLLDDELSRPAGPDSSRLEGHLISAILLLLDRWYEDLRAERPAADDADVELVRRFIRVLARDYARHHDVAHYADELRVPAAALSRALTEVMGRGTKELVLDQVMTEAARLLRFTDMSVQQVALQVGYDDPLYFSRAFKRHFGESPVAYREATRGRRQA